jgi:predicted dehydrogenase
MTSHLPSASFPELQHGGVGRRDFVKVAAAAAAIPMIATGSATATPRRRDPLRVGVIGCGGRGTGAALQALRADKDAVLVAMGDVFQDRIDSCLKNLTEELGDAAAAQVRVDPEKRFTGFDAYQKVIDAGVDVVLLTSYPAFRPAHLKAAIDAGKHVFAEKPVAVDGPGVRSVLESAAAAKRKNLSLLVGFCWRHNDGMKAMFEQINGGAVGDVLSVHTTYHTTTLSKRPRKPEWSELEFQMRNWWHFTWVSGDHIVEQAVHSIDRLNWALNDRIPTKVTCLGGRAARSGPEHGNAFDHFAAVYEYEGGLRAFHTCRQQDGTPNDNTDYVYGTKGMAVVNGWNPTYVVKDLAGKETWRYAGPTDRDMYQNEHDVLFAGIRAGKHFNDGERSTNSTLTAIMARMAAYTGQTITWQQALESKESLVPDQLSFDMTLETPAVAIPGKTKFL